MDFIEKHGKTAITPAISLGTVADEFFAPSRGKLPSLNYADKLKLILEKAKIQAEWPQNALRHSFASYHFAKHKNEDETAGLMDYVTQDMVIGILGGEEDHRREFVGFLKGCEKK